MQRLVKVWQVGKIDYLPSLKLQKHVSQLHFKDDNSPNTLLLVEHSPVYTIGIRTKEYSEEDEKKLKRTGADYYKTNRGGLITFHGPGQLVVYPILNLKHFKCSMRWYVCQIEKTVINLCNSLGLNATTSPHTGVWIGNNKVCAVGVHGSRFITTHGLALNCCTNLDWYDHIVPCGIKDKGVTSLSKELNRHVSIEEIVPQFLNSFSKEFDCSYTDFPNDQMDKILSEIEQSS